MNLHVSACISMQYIIYSIIMTYLLDYFVEFKNNRATTWQLGGGGGGGLGMGYRSLIKQLNTIMFFDSHKTFYATHQVQHTAVSGKGQLYS